MTVLRTEISPGVARLDWSTAGDLGFQELVRLITSATDEAFAGTIVRVEAYILLDDVPNQRAATFSGLRREGVARGAVDGIDRIVYARLIDDLPVTDPEGFRSLLNSFLPRKRAISQMLVRDTSDRVLLCNLTYKRDWDLPGGVVEVGESPFTAVSREVREELALEVPAGELLLTDWLPPWSGWDDAVCLVFDGGVHDPAILDTVVRQEREILDVDFCTPEEIQERCADFTARRIEAALNVLNSPDAPRYTESGRTPSA